MFSQPTCPWPDGLVTSGLLVSWSPQKDPTQSWLQSQCQWKDWGLEKACVSVGWTEGSATKSTEIDFDNVAAINPVFLKRLPLHPEDNLPLQVKVTKQTRMSVSSTVPSPKPPPVPTLAVVHIPTQENEWSGAALQVPACSFQWLPAPWELLPCRGRNAIYTGQRGGQCAKAASSVRRNSCVVRTTGKIKNEREEKKAHSERRMKWDNSFPNGDFAGMIKDFRVTLGRHPLTLLILSKSTAYAFVLGNARGINKDWPRKTWMCFHF